MQPHQERAIAEKAELDERLAKLKAFLGSEAFVKVAEDEQDRLDRQADTMAEYSGILGERIAAFAAP
jgi:hypothetical protein